MDPLQNYILSISWSREEFDVHDDSEDDDCDDDADVATMLKAKNRHKYHRRDNVKELNKFEICTSLLLRNRHTKIFLKICGFFKLTKLLIY